MFSESMIDYLSTAWLMALLLAPVYVWLEWKFPLQTQQEKLPMFRQVAQDAFWDRCDAYCVPLVLGSINFLFYSYVHPQISTWWVLSGHYLARHQINLGFTLRQIDLQNVFLQFAVLFLLRDLMKYAMHRWMHRNVFLWRFHILHHSSKSVNWISSFRTHWAESILWSWGLLLPTLFLNTPPVVVGVFAILECHLSFLGHANVRITFGPLKRILNNSVAHHWHHSQECLFSGGQNFGAILLIWDRLFGTYYCPVDQTPPAVYGLAVGSQYPESWWGRFFYPFLHKTQTAAEIREDL